MKCKYMFLFPLKNLARKGLMYFILKVLPSESYWHHCFMSLVVYAPGLCFA